MKEYCVDLELAKELKENGFPQNTYNEWSYVKALSNNKVGYEWVWVFGKEMNRKCLKCISAPISDEILKELPNEISVSTINSFNEYYLRIDGWDDGGESFDVYYENYHELSVPEPILTERGINCKKLQNGLAKMWLYLKKGGYLR